jgi:hypothetical protein
MAVSASSACAAIGSSAIAAATAVKPKLLSSYQRLPFETPLRRHEFAEGLNVGENVVGARNGAVQRDLAPVDPGDGQPERLATDQIGELHPACRISPLEQPA